jgi:hypothetical protein
VFICVHPWLLLFPSRRDSLSYVAILLRNIDARQAGSADFQHLRRGILIALFISGNQLTF